MQALKETNRSIFNAFVTFTQALLMEEVTFPCCSERTTQSYTRDKMTEYGRIGVEGAVSKNVCE